MVVRFYNPDLPLDIKKLMIVTGGKASHKEALLDLFFQNITDSLLILEKYSIDGEQKKWQIAAEEISNLADAIGAKDLAESSRSASGMFSSPSSDKKKALSHINSNIQSLRAFLRGLN